MAAIVTQSSTGGGGGGASEVEEILNFTAANVNSVFPTSVSDFLDLVGDYTWVFLMSWVDDATYGYFSKMPTTFETYTSSNYNVPLYVPAFKQWYEKFTSLPSTTIPMSGFLLHIQSESSGNYFAPNIRVDSPNSNNRNSISVSVVKDTWVTDGSKNHFILYGVK